MLRKPLKDIKYISFLRFISEKNLIFLTKSVTYNVAFILMSSFLFFLTTFVISTCLKKISSLQCIANCTYLSVAPKIIISCAVLFQNTCIIIASKNIIFLWIYTCYTYSRRQVENHFYRRFYTKLNKPCYNKLYTLVSRVVL